MLERGGLKIAVIGLTTEDTAKLGNPDVTENAFFKTLLKQQNTLAEINQKENPTYVSL